MKDLIKHIVQSTLVLVFCIASAQTSWAEVITSPTAVSDLLNRIGGEGAASRFVTQVDESLASNGNDVFVIGSSSGKPCIKGSSILAVTTGINWYLNHYAHVNLAWNNLTTDLTSVSLPVPTSEETHKCSVPYRYYLNYCTFSYSMSTWTWDRWQKEIDWMALHGINMPLQIVGLDVVWYNLLTEDLGYTSTEANKFIAGPCFQAWWGMNNLQGWGGPNPDWWYKRQATLCKNILARQRELGMDPVLPGYAGMVPSDISSKGYAANNQGNWCYFVRPYILDPNSDAFATISELYYKRLAEVMGTSKYYSMDPFHEGANTSGIDVPSAYKKIAQAMLNANSESQWVIQFWQWSSAQYNVLSQVSKGKLIVLDLFSDAHTHFGEYNGHDAVYCMLPNFGGRTGLFGRLTKVMKEFYTQKTQNSNIKGIGATPEAIEQVPVLYDALFELPWRTTAPDAQQWLTDYTTSRYGTANAQAAEAWEKLRLSALNCETSLQGPHEAVLCARPALSVGSVSSWGGTDIFYDAQDVAQAAFSLLSAKGELSGENYSYDLTDVSRQALTDYGYYLLKAIQSAHTSGDKSAYATRRDAYLQLMLDLDDLLNTNKNFMLGRWTNMARGIADEADGTTESDKQWLELNNARTLITTWGEESNSESGGLRDYSYREWGGMMKDFYYDRWKTYFANLDAGSSQPNWFNHDWNWAHNSSLSYSDTPVGSTADVATRLLGKYFLPFGVSADNIYYISRYFATNKQDEISLTAIRGTSFELPISNLPEGVTATFSVDLNGDGSFGNGETVQATSITIPADAKLGKAKALLELTDGTQFTFTLVLKDNITQARTISVSVADAAQGSVSIEGVSGSSVSTMDDVTVTAKAKSGYDFYNWTDADGNIVSSDNPYTYVGAADIALTANFIVNKWGSPKEDASELSTIDSYGQYLTSLGIIQNEQDEQSFYTASQCPSQLFQTTSVIQAARGSQITLHWTSAGGLNYCNLSAYIDLNADGDFSDDGELVAAVGKKESADNTQLNDYQLKILLPYDIPEGVTHIRLRFDGAWMSGYNSTTGAMDAKASTMRMVYDVPLNITAYCSTACTVGVKTSAEEKGTVDANGQPDNYVYGVGEEIVLRAYPATGYMVKSWTDKYGRTVPDSWRDGNFLRFRAPESGTYTAVFAKELPTELVLGNWTFNFTEDDGNITLTKVVSGSGEMVIPATYEDYSITSFADGLLHGQESLTALSIPASITSLGEDSDNPFRGCTNLEELKVASANKTYRAQSNVLLSNDGTTLLAYPEGRLSHRYTLSNSVKSIAAHAFTQAPQLERLIVSAETPATLGSEAFENVDFFVQPTAKYTDAYRSAFARPIVLNVSATSSLSAANAALLTANDAVDLSANDTQCGKAPEVADDVQVWYTRTLKSAQAYPVCFPFVPTSVSVEGLKMEDTPVSALALFEYSNGTFVRTTNVVPGSYLLVIPDSWSGKRITFRFPHKGTSAAANAGLSGNGTTDALQVTGDVYAYDATTNTFTLQHGTSVDVQPFCSVLVSDGTMPETISGPNLTSGIHNAVINSQTNERLYTPAGKRITKSYHGITISDSGAKRIRK